jgi:SnoaL-like domain
MKFRSIATIVTFLSVLAIFPTHGQQINDDKAVREVIHTLFLGMEKGDSSMVRSVFAGDVTTATIRRDKNNVPAISHETSVDGFVKAVGTPHPDTWYEEIWGLKISIDGDFAQAWCDYAFYRGTSFSHCGVDSFELFRTPEGWKIFHLADTRRATPCNVPDNIKNKHKS